MEQLPPWLRNLPLPPRPPGRGAAPTSAAASAVSAEEVPSWLADLQSEVAADRPASAQEQPDWLSDLAAEVDSAGAPPPIIPDDTTNSRIRMPVSPTEWLTSIGQNPDAASEILSEPVAPHESDVTGGVPDWLRDLTEDEVARAVEADEGAEPLDPEALPGWLTDDGLTDEASTVSAHWPDAELEAEPEAPDWLSAEFGVDPAQVRAKPASGPTGGVEVPAWLRDLSDETAPDAETSTNDEPAWLSASAPSSAQTPAAASDVPDWLVSAEPSHPASPLLEAESDQPPTWIRELTPEPEAAPQAEEVPAWLDVTAAAPSDDVPAWLQGGAAAPAAPSDDVPAWLQGTEGPPATTPGSGIPSWLDDASVSGSSVAPPSWLDAAPDLSSSEAPAWLSGGDAPAAPSSEVPAWLSGGDAPVAPSSPSPAPNSETPPWLASNVAPTPAKPAADDTDSMPSWLLGDSDETTSGVRGTADPGLPSWLRGVASEPEPPSTPLSAPPPTAQPPRRTTPTDEEGASHAFLSGAELPSWLRIPEPERPAEVPQEELGWLRRLGGNEADEEAPTSVPATPMVVLRRPTYARTAEQLSAMALLQQISRQPYPALPAPPIPQPLTRWQRIGLDRVLYTILLVALLLGAVAPVITTPFQTANPVAPGVEALDALLAGFDSDDVAVVAYEWSAQRSAELRPLEAALMSRLIANRTRMILLSTDIQGTLLSFDLIGPLQAAGYNNENGMTFGGRDYVLLGYRPGGELALRRIAQDLQGELRSDFYGADATESEVALLLDGTPRFTGINDVSLIVVMADTAQDVQAWMEQVRPAARAVPIVFLLPHEALPLAQPYLRQPGVYYVAGQQGALALQARDPNRDPALTAQTGGLLMYAVAIYLLILVGGYVSIVIGRARSRQEVTRER